MRLYERDFGDYEGKLFSEVDIDSLRRWTDNTPTPNGETIRELASRVFDWMDTAIEKYENEGKKAILLVVHGHVLRALHWYFNGVPESDEITLPKSDNCEVFEFDTAQMLSKMKNYRIILDRQELEEKLKRISKTPYTGNYNFCFAMCYMPGEMMFEYVPYKCDICHEETRYEANVLWRLESAKRYVEDMKNTRLQVDVEIDELDYCKHCTGKDVENPMPIFKIRFSQNEKYHEVKTDDDSDYECILAFLQGKDNYENCHRDATYPLNEQIEQLVRMTGLCPEIVENWKVWFEELKENRAFETISMGVNRVVYGEEAKIIKNRERLDEELKNTAKSSKTTLTREDIDNLLCYAVAAAPLDDSEDDDE
jgi:hypothetical protein